MDVIELFLNKAGQYQWRVRAENGNILLTSPQGDGYSAKKAAYDSAFNFHCRHSNFKFVILDADGKPVDQKVPEPFLEEDGPTGKEY